MANARRRLTGKVVSDKMDKTVVVEVISTKIHPLYHKVIRTKRRYMAHDESNAAQIGDGVEIVESKPISRRKRWVVQQVLSRTAVAEAVESEAAAES